MADYTGLTETLDVLSLGTTDGVGPFPTGFTYTSVPTDALVANIADASGLVPPDMKPLFVQFVAQSWYSYRI
jgi:hypothetical protein